MPDELAPITTPPTPEELNARVETVRRLMAENHLDCYVVAQTDNVYYLTHFAYQPMERPFFLIVPMEGRPVLVLPTLEIDHARSRVLLDLDYEAYDEFPAPTGRTYSDALKRRISGDSKIGVESSLSLAHFQAMPGSPLVADVVEEARLVKSEYEIGRIVYACRVVEEGLRKVFELGRPGTQILSIYSEGVRQMMGKVILEIPDVNLLASKYLCAVWPTTLSAQPHAVPGLFDSLEAGGPQVCILAAQANGYSAELERTFFIDHVPETAKKPFDAAMEARARAFELIKPGVRAEDVDREVLQVIKNHGYGDGILHRTGHGFGITGHEAPWIAMGSDAVFEKNMVISIEPGIYIPNVGGFRHSDTVLVTDDGCLSLTHAPDRLEDLILPL